MEKEASYLLNKPPSENNPESRSPGYTTISAPQISLPRGGGAIKSIDEKFSVNAANGTSGCSIPFPFSPSRNGFMPGLSLNYNSGSGNGIFGLGWNAEAAAIVRKTEKKLPEYNDGDESDIFIFSGAEDLVPSYKKDGSGNWIKDSSAIDGLIITRYRPRIEGGFSRIEKIKEASGNVYWKVTTGNNVVSVFGKSKSAQVFNPADPTRIFKWLLEFSYDDKGNCFQYEYKKEDKINVGAQVHEKNRLNDFSVCTNAYVKRIKYCNKNHFNRGSIDFSNWESFLGSIDYLLELVLDYGEHDSNNPQTNDDSGWTCRTDPFSDYRAGFEIRTYRLCKRVLMFHRFTELGTTPCLVRSMDIEYNVGGEFTFLQSITQKGYIRKADGSYSQKSLPPVEFSYEQLGWNTEIRSLPATSLENLPTGIDDGYYQWIDLYHEGISGVLTEQAGSWYYKGNAGDGHLEGIQLVSPKPSLSGVATGALHLRDIEAKGQQFLVSDDLHGYYELSDDNEWLPFKNFDTAPNIDLRDPNVKLLDLNGDGMADILISEEEVFTWYASKGKEGFENYHTTRKLFDEEKGPNIVFADSTQSIVLADMSGDGLMDIVRIRYSEVVYWPNLGYGKFGAKVTMSNAPVFDRPEDFNPKYIKLADLDGSGITDIVYLGNDSFKIYFNQSGNGWSEENIIKGVNPLPFAKIDEHSTITIIDLLGNGTGCIAWSSSLPQHTGNQLRYIDLMGGKKPHVMTAYKNNMGKEVFVEYKPSTYYYLQDKKGGTPWITKLPFPVQCVSQVVMIDQIRKSRFTNQYTYHHGYYDHQEREFRGFGRVDQTDTEDFENFKKLSDPHGVIQLVDEGFHQPPVLTKTWFHTGAFLDKEKIFTQFAHEYYSNSIIAEKELNDPPLPADLTIDEWREALRACKGIPLRTEVYTPDGSDKAQHPYSTNRYSCLVQLLQPKLLNAFAVFTVQQSESLIYSYERNPADPRIAHSMTLETDHFGNVLKGASINYGRKKTDENLTLNESSEQSKIHIIFTENNFTNSIDNISDYCLPVGYESKSYELTGLMPAIDDYFTIEEIKTSFEQTGTIAYEALPTTGKKEKRLIEQIRTVFLKNDLTGPLDLGVIESLLLPYQSFKLSMTPALRDFIFGDKVSDALLINEGRYVHLGDDNYWIASGTKKLDAHNFYQLTEETDPFGFKITLEYDSNYRFFTNKTIDALGNETAVLGFNYRTLSAYLMSDINNNRSGVRIDELGMVTSTFVMAKEGENKGDLMDTSAVEASPGDQPGGTIEYDLLFYKNTGQPNFTKTTIRETHYYDNIQTGLPVLSHVLYGFADGGGGVIMQKRQADPGLALRENEDGTVTEVDTTPHLRWIGNGRTILNNKGKAVKQFEPYFSTTFEFEDAKQLVERGLSPLITYDAAGRAIRIDRPDGTFSKVEFDAWMQGSFDQNDTVLESQWYKDRIISPVQSIATPEEVAAANKAAEHANTPSVAYSDSLGRSFIAIADNGTAGKYKVRSEIDIENNLRSVTDAAGNLVTQYKFDMLGAQLYHHSMDTGEQWLLNDVMGKPLRNWDNKNNILRYECDALHRPVKIFVQQGNAPEINIEKVIYGETLENAKANNLRGRAYKHYDTAGISTANVIDFKGNVLSSSKQFLKNYKDNADWNTLSDADLEPEIFITTSTFDAINRPLQSLLPEGSITRPVYNEAGILKQMLVSIKGTTETQFVKNIVYDAKGQRQSIVFGNDTSTTYGYDTKTLRLARVLTTGNNGTGTLQQLQYSYDAIGNTSFIKDSAQADIFFNNAVVKAENDFVHDAIYRLIQASGREQVGQNTVNETSTNNNFRNFPFENNASADDMQAMRNYTQKYIYDATGNMLQLQHIAGTGSYTRVYQYNNNDADRDALQIDVGTVKNNQLLATTIGNNTIRYQYDVHGNMLNQPHLQQLMWNFREELQQIDLGGGGKAYYVYDGNGNRVRKIIERQGGIKEERIYLNGFELYRRTDSNGILQEQTETLHVMDDTRRIAIVETKTVKDGVHINPGSWQPLIRYQYSNYLGSSSLELDENGVTISFEEYHPYGTTSVAFNNKDIEAAAKRYRYTGMERDDESGLEYHGARYYLPWLGRWLSPDPSYYKDGFNIYQYAQCRPAGLVDITGNDSRQPQQQAQAFLESIGDTIYKAHSTGNDAALGNELEKAIYAGFVKAGEAAMSECSKKIDKLALFDKGVEVFAKRYHVEQYFRAEAEAGNRAYNYFNESSIGVYEEPIPVRDALGYTYFVKGPFIGTKAEHEWYLDQRENNRKLLPIAVMNLLASANPHGLPGGGEAPVAEPVPVETQSGARLEPAPLNSPSSGSAPARPAPARAGRAELPSAAPEHIDPEKTPVHIEVKPNINEPVIFDDGYTIRATWPGDPVALFRLEKHGDDIVTLDLYRGNFPKGSGGKLQAAVFNALRIRPSHLILTNIINAPTVAALAEGKSYLDTVLGNSLKEAVKELGGTIESIKPTEYRHKPAYDVIIKYPPR